jgi:hypothetical protein
VACVPVFFQPSGSDSQLIYGLMICFVSFGAYVHFDPYEDRGNDAVARLSQMQIFFSLLASVALTSASEQNAGSNMDILLVVLYCLPVRLPCTHTWLLSIDPCFCHAHQRRLGWRSFSRARCSRW